MGRRAKYHTLSERTAAKKAQLAQARETSRYFFRSFNFIFPFHTIPSAQLQSNPESAEPARIPTSKGSD